MKITHRAVVEAAAAVLEEREHDALADAWQSREDGLEWARDEELPMRVVKALETGFARVAAGAPAEGAGEGGGPAWEAAVEAFSAAAGVYGLHEGSLRSVGRDVALALPHGRLNTDEVIAEALTEVVSPIVVDVAAEHWREAMEEHWDGEWEGMLVLAGRLDAVQGLLGASSLLRLEGATGEGGRPGWRDEAARAAEDCEAAMRRIRTVREGLGHAGVR